ncbi:MAG: bifunctional folylpolyglutamate synthase/dihydrofolate synthase [bacterium]|nr:bifunctional folylpolyglutamate synthase/dihydrofolate synthase [bacterium]
MTKGISYQQTLDFLFTQLPMYQRQGASAYKKDLSNTIALCEALGNPQHGFKSVHLAGTNGKGTTAHTIASVLQEAGFKTALHTSPHLKDFRERIKINGEMVSEEFVVDFVESNQDVIKELEPSFFEITVVMAFEYFKQQEVDIAIIETGMGGRLDSTNVINPLVSAITAIGLDHMKFLGNDLVSIASEKAGIVKKETPVVLYDFKKSEVKEVFLEKAKKTNSFVNDLSESYQIIKEENTISLASEHIDLTNINPAIKGDYYLSNLPVALEVIHELRNQGFNVDENCIKQGIQNVVTNTGLKGRWQILQNNPYVFADVGHNADGIKVILNQLSNMSYLDLHIVWGSVNDKDINEIFDLLPSDAFYYFCESNIPRALPLSDLLEIGKQRKLQYQGIKDVNEALKEARAKANPQDVIWVGGSTFVVAELDEL